MTNPYAPPSVDLNTDTERSRPRAVWILSIWFALAPIAQALVLLTGLGDTPESMTRRAAIGAGAPAIVAVNFLLCWAFAVSLFRLQRRTLLIFLALACVWFGQNGVRWILIGPPHTPALLADSAIGAAVYVAIYLYLRRLRTRGVLR